MIAVSLEEAQARLSELIEQVQEGEEILITRQGQPVARLLAGARIPPRQPGFALGKLTNLAEDDEHLEDFQDYMP